MSDIDDVVQSNQCGIYGRDFPKDLRTTDHETIRPCSHLAKQISEMHVRYGFERIVVVAHSMGGLVSRGALLRQSETESGLKVPLFVSIATPWGGISAARYLDGKTFGLYSWGNLSPNSAFIQRLWSSAVGPEGKTRALPKETRHHSIFGGLPDKTGSDGSIALSRQLHPPAQAQAVALYGIEGEHMARASDLRTAAILKRLLNELE